MRLLGLKGLMERTAEVTLAVYQGQEMPLPPLSIDTRTLQKGDLFVAIRGSNFDGHHFVKEALKKGACGVMVEEPVGEKGLFPYVEILVKDTVQALGEMAKVWRGQFQIPIIAVTGSCGKTGTKEMIASILSEVGPTLFTKGNLNNHLGMPLALLQLNQHHRFAVLEVGASRPGEIRYLVELAKPTVGLITNIQASHLEGFGSLSGIAKEKSEVYRGLTESGIAVVNWDEPFAVKWAELLKDHRCLSFSLDLEKHADLMPKNRVYSAEGVSFDLVSPIGTQAITLKLLGDHVIPNALAASAASMAVGASLAALAKGLANVKPMKGRMLPHRLNEHTVLIDDTYNASASAVENAIKYLGKVPGKRIFVMSHMAEMGPDSAEYHSKMGQFILDYGIDQVFLTGNREWLEPTLEVAKSKTHYFPSSRTLIEALEQTLSKWKDQPVTVLVKGCRSARMEIVVEALLNQQGKKK